MATFELNVQPDEIILFADPKLGEVAVTTTLKITNPTSKHISYKVKCTSNEIFRIRPPLGLLAPNASADVVLIFNSGKTIPDNRKHYFAIYYVSTDAEKSASKSARQIWTEHPGEPEGTRRIYVNFEKAAKKVDVVKDEPKVENKEEVKPDDDGQKDAKKDAEKKDAPEEKKDEPKGDEKKDGDAPPKPDEDKKEAPKEEEKKDGEAAPPLEDKKDDGGEDKKAENAPKED